MTLVVVPCVPGTFMRYSYPTKDSDVRRCENCPTGYYQNHFGLNDCIRCPFMGLSLAGSDNEANCTSMSYL